ncbi:MAG: AAA family ATPase [Burkholderiales bacterium]|nr:AAA family ATPase [Burkholderiales bacterium]
MRLCELGLLAYGRFTDHHLRFPQSSHDFHVIVGPNEAGKSTVRRAITELLFGMELRSPLGFKHAQADLRVSGVLETAAGPRDFVRTKQQKSLRSMAGDPLPDSYLDVGLGALTREVFEQMHCLDHARLLHGGQSIVDPRNSVSQILFQAASGLDDFAAVRDALGERAANIFTSRGRNNRYSGASERFTSAQKVLKDVQVRTREWVDARDALKSAQENLETVRREHRALELERSAWERSRRLAPIVTRLDRLQSDIDVLGDTRDFPAGARKTLATGIADMEKAISLVKTRERDVSDRQEQLDAVEVDADALAHASGIDRLSRLCALYESHAADIVLRRSEASHWLAAAIERGVEFGWGDAEDMLRSRLPQERILRAIDSLLKERGALLADKRAAEDGERDRIAALDELRKELEELPERDADPRLVEALEQALPYKASEARQDGLRGAVATALAEAQRNMVALGRPAFTEDDLRTMQVPSPERVSAMRSERQGIAQARDVARQLMEQHAESASQLELRINQFARSHKIVTSTDVHGARQERDEAWGAIKSGVHTLAVGAPRLDATLRLADQLVDAHTLSEADGASLQSLRDQLEVALSDEGRERRVLEEREGELSRVNAQWEAQASALGLAGLLLDDLSQWLAKRDKALLAADTLEQKRQELAHECECAAKAQQTVSEALTKAGFETPVASGLAAMCAAIEEHLQKVDRTRTRRETVVQQIRAADTALKTAAMMREAKGKAVDDWGSRWNELLVKAHLGNQVDDVSEAEAAIEAAAFIRQSLGRIDAHRAERIQPMEADLQALQQVAEGLVDALVPDQQGANPEALSRTLGARLEQAKRQSLRKDQAQESLDGAERQLSEARTALDQAKARLQPLMRCAEVEDPLDAVPLVDRAEKKSELLAELKGVRAELEASADGMTLEQARAGLADHPVAHAEERMLTIRDRLEHLAQSMVVLAQDELKAKQGFDPIDGGAKAAVAESQKQEALSEMAEAAEEYLHLATAGTLLQWAVDRYRDRKQGPLLQRASAIFQGLTRGSFEKLRVDYESTPPALLAYRPENQAVKVSGLSDGTRDQLFLALRIAALELQADQGTPVPFIADDLFINFDDARSAAGLQALHALAAKTQVIFLTHQEHLLPVVRSLFPEASSEILTADASGSALHGEDHEVAIPAELQLT